ncbi:MAG: hypothetical protein HUK20_08785 [Fibrobacter sp.]|nr:hypothetical protein [Fibrobacter sp.]
MKKEETKRSAKKKELEAEIAEAIDIIDRLEGSAHEDRITALECMSVGTLPLIIAIIVACTMSGWWAEPMFWTPLVCGLGCTGLGVWALVDGQKKQAKAEDDKQVLAELTKAYKSMTDKEAEKAEKAAKKQVTKAARAVNETDNGVMLKVTTNGGKVKVTQIKNTKEAEGE